VNFDQRVIHVSNSREQLVVLTPSVRRSALVALVAGLVLALLAVAAPSGRAGKPAPVLAPVLAPVAAKVSGYTPVTGAIFNRPIGPKSSQRRIFTHVNKTIDAVPRGGTIRIAVFSFAEKATADALLRARARGVNVQMIIDDHTIYAQEARLRRALGKNASARSYMLYCAHSCRGTKGDMHDKFFLFSHAGRAKNVTMVGSNNMTSYNAQHQWSDVYTVANDRAMYATYSYLFAKLRTNKPVSKPFYERNVSNTRSTFFPALGMTQATDPLMQTLSAVRCTGATAGTGVAGRTVVRIAQHAWYGPRGVYLAKKVAALRTQGCIVQVVAGITMGSVVRSTLVKAKVSLAPHRRSGVYTHQKTMTISGVFGGDTSSRMVFTGSHNWSDRGLTNDDVILRVDNAAAYAKYVSNFRDMWHNG
jgi:phosphatidylserine/phosphatidylglycerophosphate/cardiolipin synthase-like enzyme